MKAQNKFLSAKNIAYLSVFTALVIVLQVFGGYFKIGATSLSFVLVPIVLGGILLGPLAGGFLGFVFGLITFLYGVTGADTFTSILFQAHPFLTALNCFAKGILAGVVAGWAYQLLARKNELLGVFVASALAPIVNTGLFILLSLPMMDTFLANFVPSGESFVYFLFIGCAGINFLVELAINLFVSPVISRVVRVVNKTILRKYGKKPQENEDSNV